MARQLDDDETRTFLSEGTRTAKLAWVTKSGRPAVTPVWFVVDERDDGFDLVFNTGKLAGKAKAFARDPYASIVVDEWLVRLRPDRITAATDIAEY